MVRNFLRMSAFSALLFAGSSQVLALNTQDNLNSALAAWRSGDLKSAQAQLTTLIDAGSNDPRLYFYRGILSTQLGQDGDADFQKGAQLEAATGNNSSVNAALERTQGTLRTRIEKFRRDARAEHKPDPKTVKAASTFREALEDRRSGDLKAALQKLESLTNGGSDARYYYMHGVVLAELGNKEKAKALFAEGLKRETSLEHVTLVNELLSSVQGDVRQLVEESATIQSGDVQITRKSNRRLLQTLAARSEDQLLAESNAATAAAERQALMELESRRREAAEEFAAERDKPEPGVAVAQVDPPAAPTETTEPSTKPEMPADATEQPMPAPGTPSTNVANPFLGGAAVTPTAPGVRPSLPAPAKADPVSSVEAGPIELAYLPENAELVFYARPADLFKSGFAAPLTQMPDFSRGMGDMKKDLGFDITEIESVTAGVANLVATALPLMMGGAGGPPGAPPDQALMAKMFGGKNSVSVLRTVSDQDIVPFLTKQGATQKTIGGATVYVIPSPNPEVPAMAVYVADAKTFVFASEDGMEATLKRSSSVNRDEFQFVSRSSHVVIAFASPLLAGMSGSIPQLPETAPPPVIQLVDAVRGKISGAGISISAGSDLQLMISSSLTEESSDAATGLTATIELAKQMAPFATASAPPAFQPVLQKMVESLSASSEAATLKVTTEVPFELVNAIQSNPEILGPIAAARAAADRTQTMNNLKQVALAMHNFHDTNRHFPAADGNGLAGTEAKGLSWRVHLLPYLEQQELYNQFHFDEPWDSEHNKSLLPLMPPMFKVTGVEEPGMTTMHIFTGNKSAFPEGKAPSIRDILDGTSNTIMAVIAGPETAQPWTKPGGLVFDEQDPLTALGTIGQVLNLVLMDGSTVSMPTPLDPSTIRLMIQPADATPVNFR
ncbi:MAG: DUF1559 domain-containing protein [Planctomycetaceae bacterium]|nr:DUF1559 domain-containing protein [Planctomycetaceae bacterium]